MEDLQKNVQASLRGFGSFFAQQMAKATDSHSSSSHGTRR